MLPADAIARLADLQFLSTLGWLTAGGLSVFVVWLGRRVDRGCPECDHCVAEVERREREDSIRNLRYLGVPEDQIQKKWGKDEDAEARATRERLFGVEVVDQPEEAELASAEGAPDDGDGLDEPDT